MLSLKLGVAVPTRLGSLLREVAILPLPRPLVISLSATASLSPGPSLGFGEGVPLGERRPAALRLRGEGLVLLWKLDGRPVEESE